MYECRGWDQQDCHMHICQFVIQSCQSFAKTINSFTYLPVASCAKKQLWLTKSILGLLMNSTWEYNYSVSVGQLSKVNEMTSLGCKATKTTLLSRSTVGRYEWDVNSTNSIMSSLPHFCCIELRLARILHPFFHWQLSRLANDHWVNNTKYNSRRRHSIYSSLGSYFWKQRLWKPSFHFLFGFLGKNHERFWGFFVTTTDERWNDFWRIGL